jgi:hypothetical protein
MALCCKQGLRKVEKTINKTDRQMLRVERERRLYVGVLWVLKKLLIHLMGVLMIETNAIIWSVALRRLYSGITLYVKFGEEAVARSLDQ